jgi:hypothetical protein
MARVDPDDDTITRIVLCHYRYDPDRRERRHVVLAAFDNEEEYWQAANEAGEALKIRQGAGLAEPIEHITGAVKPAGYAEEARLKRAEWRMLKHGVWPMGSDPERTA